MLLHLLRNQRGSALLLALVTMLVLMAASGVYYAAATPGLSSSLGYSYANNAHYAAEAGIRYALAHARQNTLETTRNWDRSTFPSGAISLSNGATFKVAVQTDTLPAGKTGTYYRITATGTAAGFSSRTLVAYFLIPPPGDTEQHKVSTFDLLKSAKYSSINPWTMNADNTVAKSPTTDQYYQALFGDQVDGTAGFTLNYNMNMISIQAGHDSDNGYGIYYMVQGAADSRDPNNMSAYVLQYDPGLNPDQILVKKVVAGYKSTTNASANEVINGSKFSGSDKNYTNYSFQSSTNPNTATWTGTTLNVNPTAGSSNDKSVISMSLIQQQIPGFSMLNQNHQLTIDVRPDANGNLVQTISIDGLQILKFIDRGANYPGTNKKQPIFISGGTGFRVWNANVEFYNSDQNNNGYTGQYIPGDPILLDSWGYHR